MSREQDSCGNTNTQPYKELFFCHVHNWIFSQHHKNDTRNQKTKKENVDVKINKVQL